MAPGHQHRADHQIGIEHRPLDLVRVGRDGLQVSLIDPVRVPQLVDVPVQQQDLGLHAERDGRGVHPGHARADHHDLRRVDPGHAAHQGAAATALPHQVVGADLRRQPTGDLAHRGEQRQRAVGQLHGLVRDPGHLAVDQRPGAVPAGGEMQVGEQRLALAHPLVLDGDRLLDLQDQLRVAPHLIMVGNDRRTGRAELVVGDRGPGAGAGLDEHLVPVAGELIDTGGGDRDPVLVVLDLGRHADLHATLLMRTSRLFADHVTINSGPLGPPSPEFRLGPTVDGA